MKAGEGNKGRKEERKKGRKEEREEEKKKGGSDRDLLVTLFDWLVAPCAM